MKIGIITIHCSNNVGASLQTHALYKKMIEIGHDPTIIDYRPWYFIDLMDEKKAIERKILHNRLKLFFLGNILKAKHDKFMAFESNYYPRKTKRYDTADDLIKDPPIFDGYVCGSDQIWNPGHIHYDGAYFFNFITHLESVKISFAASLGQDHLDETGKNFLKKMITNLNYISVREDTAVSLLCNELKIMNVEQNIDPTLLFDSNYWRTLSTPVQNQQIGDYFLFYPLTPNPITEGIIKRIKKKTGLKCVTVSTGLRKPGGTDIQISLFDPLLFLSLIDNAKLVLTNSFHGVVFSLLFKKRLISYKREERNCRIDSLLRLLHLNDIQVTSINDYSERDWNQLYEKYDGIDQILEIERVKATQFLTNALRNGKY